VLEKIPDTVTQIRECIKHSRKTKTEGSERTSPAPCLWGQALVESPDLDETYSRAAKETSKEEAANVENGIFHQFIS